MMGKLHYVIFLFLLFYFSISKAQVFDPVDWNFSAERITGDEYELKFLADIDKGWYLYSQLIPEDGPIPTTFTIEENPKLEITGTTTESGPKIKEGYDKMFDMNIKKFAEAATFIQKVRASEPLIVKGYVTFMVCDDERCLPPTDVDFEIPLTDEEDNGEQDPEIESDEGNYEQGSNETEEESITDENTLADNIIGSDNQDQNDRILKPVEWKINASKEGNKIHIEYTADIENNWYVYSQSVPQDGPVPTSFHFDTTDDLTFHGTVSETGSKVKEGFDEIFQMNIKKFARRAEFRQTIEVNNQSLKEIKGYFEFMTCDDTRCLPPEYVDFVIDVQTAQARIIDPNEEISSAEGNAEKLDLNLNYQPDQKGESAIWVFIFGLLGGLFALITPCVFPMIPLTVSFFTKSSGDGSGLMNAILYGISIFLIYILLSAPFHLLNLAPDVLNQISTSVELNIAFFLIFLAFAISFFGYYELTIPAGFANKISKIEGKGGLIGIFFMALTLAIVSFSCTGPIIGTLLAGTLSKGAWHLSAGMAGFGLALGLPFALFALFPSWLNNLPKSGGWMNSVKVVLGFAELGLALKFLSIADLVAHWGIIKREVFFGIWILICILTIAYLLGAFNFPHDSKNRKIGKGGLAFTVMLIAFTIYIIPGTWGKNIALISGFPPPMYYKFLETDLAKVEFATNVSEEDMQQFQFSEECPYGIPCFKDYFEAEKYARHVDKPILLDFTGFGCVNCRKMEENVWPEEGILDILGTDLVLASLYVDDRKSLPDGEVRTAMANNYSKKLRNIGNKWSFFQTINFKENSQPSYVILSPEREILMEPIGYTPNPAKFKRHLLKALDEYRNTSITSSR